MRILFFILIILVIAWFLTMHYHFSLQEVPLPMDLVLPPASSCGLTVSQPLPGSSISYQVTVSGIISNAQRNALGCSWTMYEGQGGQAEITDASGDVLAGPVAITVDDWTATTTNFSAYLDLLANSQNPMLSEGEHLTIHLVPENPSGQANSIHLDMPVTLRE